MEKSIKGFERVLAEGDAAALRDAHGEIDSEIRKLSSYRHLTPAEENRLKALKKIKLKIKERITALHSPS